MGQSPADSRDGESIVLGIGRDYQERAAVSTGQGQGASSGTASAETAGYLCVAVHAYCACV